MEEKREEKSLAEMIAETLKKLGKANLGPIGLALAEEVKKG